eukprot:364475-Chlamydomonas_euryale.AAC.13
MVHPATMAVTPAGSDAPALCLVQLHAVTTAPSDLLATTKCEAQWLSAIRRAATVPAGASHVGTAMHFQAASVLQLPPTSEMASSAGATTSPTAELKTGRATSCRAGKPLAKFSRQQQSPTACRAASQQS